MAPVAGSVRAVGWTLTALLLLAGAEGVARLAVSLQDSVMSLPGVRESVNRSLALDPYEMPSPRHGGHWTLRPGYGAATEAVIADKLASGKAMGAAAIAEATRQAGAEGRLVVNADGFKGPPLDPAHSRPRVLVIGDSVTFGYVQVDIVRALDDALARQGTAAECVNAGVEGYSFRNALLELDRYRAAKPDVVVVLLGWNDIMSMRGDEHTLAGRLASLRLLRHLTGHLGAGGGADPVAAAEELRSRPKRPRADDPMVAAMAGLDLALVDKAERLGDALAAAKARVVLATLPGLFVSGEMPNAEALELGHLPPFTDNPLVLAALTDAANRGLRRLAADKGWGVVDLDGWSRSALAPRERHFVDSVHMTNPAIAKVGEKLAEDLAPLLR